MKILAIDTSTRCQSVAVLDQTALLAQNVHEHCSSHASLLIPAIQRLLASIPRSLSSIEGLAASAGPGSFTGLRVGLSTMIGFRMVTGLPLVTVPTLEAMAWSHQTCSHVLCPMLVSRAQEVYWARFQWRNGRLVRLSEDRVGSIQEVIDSSSRPTVFWGEGWLRHQSLLTETLGDSAVGGSLAFTHPSAYHVGLASLSYFQTGNLAGRRPAPHYVQRAEADIRWDSTRPRNLSPSASD